MDMHGLMPAHPALCRFQATDRRPHLGWWEAGTIADLTAAGSLAGATLSALLASGTPLAALAATLAAGAPRHDPEDVTLLAPLDLQEIWAAGVTYERSRQARMSESGADADVYARVYGAERPELFYKGDARRTAGPGGEIRARPDARWTVPEPELALLLDPELRIAGYTIGNDVSSRDIEGENPLYLPQAKVYTGACALGPWIVPAESVADPYALAITCSISRDGVEIWRDETSTAKLHRRLDELVRYLGMADAFPHGVFLLTGTCLVPPDSISLEPGDVVEIAIGELGMLRNLVGRWPAQRPGRDIL